MSQEPDDLDAIFEQFGDVFGDMFGGGKRIGRGADIRMEIELDREDLIRGARAVTVERFIGCEGCHGTGREPAATDPCRSCEGKGQQMTQKGAFRISANCPDCKGSGSARECTRCGGEAGKTRRETLKVTIPPEIRDGQTLRLRGKGCDNSDGKGAGDLYIAIRIPEAVPAGSPTAIPVNESGGATMTTAWIGLGIAVLVIVFAALLLR